jgi:hypothetical protein
MVIMTEAANSHEAHLDAALKLGLERRIIAAALAAAKDPDVADDAYAFAAAAYHKLGETAKAEQIVERIGSEQRVYAYTVLGSEEGSDSPYWDKALELVEDQDEHEQKALYRDYALALVQDGQLDVAAEMALKSGKDAAIVEVASAFCNQGEPERAIDFLGSVEEAWIREVSVAMFVIERCAVGEAALAHQAMSLVKGKNNQFVDHARIRLATFELEQGDIAAARAAAADISSPDEKRRIMEAIPARGVMRIGRSIMRLVRRQGQSESAPDNSVYAVAERVRTLLAGEDLDAALLASREMEPFTDEESQRKQSKLVIEPLLEYAAKAGNIELASELLERVAPQMRLRSSAAIAAAEGWHSPQWSHIIGEIERTDNFQKIGNLEDLFSIVHDMPVEAGADPSLLLGEEFLVKDFSPLQLRLLGSAAYTDWAKFDAYDNLSFARLAHGAAEIANSFMTDEERLQFIRNLSAQFVAFKEGGMFDSAAASLVLKHMSEALVSVDDPGATNELLKTLNANIDNAVGLRLIKSLVESGNATAGAAGIRVMYNPDTPSEVFRYLLYKLAQTNYIDESMPEAIANARDEGLNESGARHILYTLYSEFGIQVDGETFSWLIDNLQQSIPNGDLSQGGVLKQHLDLFIERVHQSKERFDGKNPTEILKQLVADEQDAMAYFLQHGGRTEYSLIKHYDGAKFRRAIATANKIQQRVDPQLIKTELWIQAPEGWQQAMAERRRPDDSLVWQIETSATTHELRATARATTKEVLGNELQWLLTSIGPDGTPPANFAEMTEDAQLAPEEARKLRGLLGPVISDVIEGKDVALPVGEFDKLKARLLSRVKQLARDQQQAQQAEQWDQLHQQIQRDDAILSVRHIPAIQKRNPAISQEPQGAVDEWANHVGGMMSDLREAQRGGPENRTLTIRYLDGTEDFTELLRFADGAQCCFTSQNTGDGQMDEGGRWRLRINRDPHWFVFSIEDTPPDAAKRQASGFVFGSVGYYQGRPAVLVNGIYMRRKTNAASNAVLDSIAEEFADKLGVPQVVVKTVHGGNFDPNRQKWEQSPEGAVIHRPRAIRSVDGEPETEAYDDLGVAVNQDEPAGDVWVRKTVTTVSPPREP